MVGISEELAQQAATLIAQKVSFSTRLKIR
jgi:hypothetical protein